MRRKRGVASASILSTEVLKLGHLSQEHDIKLSWHDIFLIVIGNDLEVLAFPRRRY